MTLPPLLSALCPCSQVQATRWAHLHDGDVPPLGAGWLLLLAPNQMEIKTLCMLLRSLPGLGLVLPMSVGPCATLNLADLFFSQNSDDICIDFSKTAFALSSAAGAVVSPAKPLAMPLSSLGSKVGMDFDKMKLPSFLGTISSARIFSAVIRLSGDKKFKAVRVGIKVHQIALANVEPWIMSTDAPFLSLF